MSNPIAAGCGEMASNDVKMISIDPKTPQRDWSPILQNSALTPPPVVATSQQQQATIERLEAELKAMSISKAACIERLEAELVAMAMDTVTIDASHLPAKDLEKMSNAGLNCFLFLNCELSVLDRVFPKKEKHGNLDPPTEYRKSAKTMREWRRLGMSQQRIKIDAYQTKTSLVASQTARKVTPTSPEHATVGRKRTRAAASTTRLETPATFTPSVGSAFRKRGKHEEKATTTTPFGNQFLRTLDEKDELPPQQLLPSFDTSPPVGAQVPTPVKAQ
jgi:hypothetical protein